MKHAPLAFAFALIPAIALAHPGHGAEVGGIGWGLAHPFTGLDHVLAMLAVGLWAAQIGKRALWILPLSFVCSMAAGAVLAMNGIRLPFVDPAILASVVGLSAFVAFAARIPLGASVATVSIAALFHGQAHSGEMPAGAAGLSAMTGLLIATILLHTVGLGSGLALKRAAQTRLIRAAGAAILAAAVLG